MCGYSETLRKSTNVFQVPKKNESKIISEFKLFLEAEEFVKRIFNKRLSLTDFEFCQDLLADIQNPDKQQ